MTTILLINPPIYDFSAYDLWAKPLGLLYLSSLFKKQGVNVELFDYMDRKSTLIESPKSNQYGCGHYIREEIEKPQSIKNIKRKYYRFGLNKVIAEKYIAALEKPDMVIIGSVMTYWYLGIDEVTKTIKKIFPDIPIVLGGIYATLCYEHAKKIHGIDHVVRGNFENLNKIFDIYNLKISINSSFQNIPAPDYSHYHCLEYFSLKASMGCPFKCHYCAQHLLNNNQYKIKSPDRIKQEIYDLSGNMIKNVAFYDDALLYNADIGIKILLKELIKDNKKFNFHTPNGLHPRFLDQELADLMFNAKFISPRFSLESNDVAEQSNSDKKISNQEFIKAMTFLNNAGYKQKEYTTYLLIGMPNQSLDNIMDSIYFVHSLGSKISLSEYSPIPYTISWNGIDSIYKQDPLFQNNTYFLSQSEYYDKLQKIKKFAKDLNNKL